MGLRIYDAGDTCVFGDMKLIAEIYQPEVIFLPIGGLYTMDPREAAYACRLHGCQKGGAHALWNLPATNRDT